MSSVDHAPERTHFLRHLTALLTAFTLVIGLCVVIWAVFAPAPGGFDRSDALLPSYPADRVFPLLGREREQFAEALLVLLVLGTFAISPLCLWVLDRLQPRARRVVSLGAQLVLGSLAIAALAQRSYLFDIDMLGWGWPRVGMGVGIAAVALTLWLLVVRGRPIVLSPRVRRVGVAVLVCATGVLAVLHLLPVVATPGSVVDPYDTGWVVNELLAPLNSLHPLGGYAAAYTNLFGYVLVPFVSLGAEPVAAAVGFVMVATAVMLAGVASVFRIVGCSWRWALAALIAVVALAGVSQYHIEFVGSSTRIDARQTAFTYHQFTPLRMLGPVLLGCLVVRAARAPSRRLLVLIGFVAALTFANNFDIGSGAAVATAVAVLLSTRPARSIRAWWGALLEPAAALGVGFGAGLVTVTVFVLAVTGRLPDLGAATVYLRVLGGGILGLPLEHLFDFHVVVIGTFIVGLIVAVAAWTTRRSRDAPATSSEVPLTAALAYFSMLGLATIIYFLNRPVITTLVAGSFLCWGVCLVLLVVGALRIGRREVRAQAVAVAALAIVVCTAFSQLAFPRPPGREIARLREGRVGGRAAVVFAKDDAALLNAQAAFIRRTTGSGGRAAILETWPDSIALEADVESVVPASGVPPVSFAEIRMLIDALRKTGSPPVYVAAGNPPELLDALHRAGYTERSEEAGLVLLRKARHPS